MINYAEQSSDQLHLYVLAGEPNIGQFEVIKQSTITTALGEIYFGILSESHFVSLKGQLLEITEICACTDGTFNSAPPINNKLMELPKTFTYSDKNWTYTFEQTKHSLKDTPAEINNHEHTLTHVFPTGDLGGPEPITVVGCTIMPTELLIESIHSYPNENIFVRTKSKFQFS